MKIIIIMTIIIILIIAYIIIINNNNSIKNAANVLPLPTNSSSEALCIRWNIRLSLHYRRFGAHKCC